MLATTNVPKLCRRWVDFGVVSLRKTRRNVPRQEISLNPLQRRAIDRCLSIWLATVLATARHHSYLFFPSLSIVYFFAFSLSSFNVFLLAETNSRETFETFPTPPSSLATGEIIFNRKRVASSKWKTTTQHRLSTTFQQKCIIPKITWRSRPKLDPNLYLYQRHREIAITLNSVYRL